jgi:hypothetical protein
VILDVGSAEAKDHMHEQGNLGKPYRGTISRGLWQRKNSGERFWKERSELVDLCSEGRPLSGFCYELCKS